MIRLLLLLLEEEDVALVSLKRFLSRGGQHILCSRKRLRETGSKGADACLVDGGLALEVVVQGMVLLRISQSSGLEGGKGGLACASENSQR